MPNHGMPGSAVGIRFSPADCGTKIKVEINKIILGEGADVLAQQPREVVGDISPTQQAQSSESVTTSALTESIPMEVQVSPTPEKTFTSDIERESAFRKTQRTTGLATLRKSLMGKPIKLIQANLQHAKAASYTNSRRFVNEQ
ncbi:hypothetical protein JTB14_017571 [Gonioctena quinquepunctata]|nr:hypothetical protein JTB14_017571 [Gonioctena quinquepunctata]